MERERKETDLRPSPHQPTIHFDQVAKHPFDELLPERVFRNKLLTSYYFFRNSRNRYIGHWIAFRIRSPGEQSIVLSRDFQTCSAYRPFFSDKKLLSARRRSIFFKRTREVQRDKFVSLFHASSSDIVRVVAKLLQNYLIYYNLHFDCT